jgi:hypothetical protein
MNIESSTCFFVVVAEERLFLVHARAVNTFKLVLFNGLKDSS